MEHGRARSAEAIEFARLQRQMANEFAHTVWQWIRNRQICRQKFRREFPIPPYTVDFCCVELKLIIEIDGKSHFSDIGLEHDRVRDQFLHNQGYEILRIPGYDVTREDRDVIERIRHFVKEAINRHSPPQHALPAAGRAGRGEHLTKWGLEKKQP